MSFLATIKGKIGNELYALLEQEAEKEVAAAIQMPLKDQYRQDQYYRPKFFRLTNLLSECQRFEALGLRISPADVIDILFKCKLLFAAQNQDEYMQRIGGGMHNFGLWRDKSSGTVDQIIERRFEALADSLAKRTLLAEVNSFVELDPKQGGNAHQKFFDDLFTKLGAPFVAFFDDGNLIGKHKLSEPRWREEYYDEKNAKEYFCAPSIGFTAEGSEIYCYWYAQAWLRTFFNILRIAGFIHPGQMNFGDNRVQFMGVKSTVFLGTSSRGCYCWEEDTREPWAKTADGSLFLSFGYRGLSQMWLDVRTYPGIQKMFLENRNIFEHLKNPWNDRTRHDVIPMLDILSSATQIPDVGAKILLIYCCLEHLFVPAHVRRDNKKYIVGGINALRSDLLPWFDRLNDLRNEYAHEGFVLREAKTRSLTVESMRNVLSLLVAKLANA